MKNLFFIFSGVLIFIALLAVGVYAFYAYSLKAINKSMENMHKSQMIAENVQITSEWKEITSEKPLEPTKVVQKVQLLIEGYKNDIHNPDFGNITLSDGTKIKPEIEIIDENGKTYKLKDSERLGNLIGFSVDEKFHSSFSFPKDVTYKAIRIRSNEPFQCKKIIWYDYDLK